jgi:hypothetical protein
MFNRDAWNSVQIARDGSNNVNVYLNGTPFFQLTGSSSVVTALSFYIQQCTSIYFSSFTCSGSALTGDNYYVGGFSIVQAQ